MLKNIEVTQDLLDYIYSHTQPLHPVQKDILTHNKTLGDIQRMQISEIQGLFLQLIIKINNVKNCLEIGTFTGFSALTMALALPNGGKIKLFGYFVGEVMKVSKGKANPQLVNEILKTKLKFQC